MDFRMEAANMRRFRDTFRTQRNVRIPDVVENFTRRRVLVMERVQGTKVDQLHGLFQSGRLSFRQVPWIRSPVSTCA